MSSIHVDRNYVDRPGGKGDRYGRRCRPGVGGTSNTYAASHTVLDTLAMSEFAAPSDMPCVMITST